MQRPLYLHQQQEQQQPLQQSYPQRDSVAITVRKFDASPCRDPRARHSSENAPDSLHKCIQLGRRERTTYSTDIHTDIRTAIQTLYSSKPERPHPALARGHLVPFARLRAGRRAGGQTSPSLLRFHTPNVTESRDAILDNAYCTSRIEALTV